MCVGPPGQVTETHDDRGTLMGTVDFGGALRSVCMVYTPDARAGDYVIVHAGFAISMLDEAVARESLALFAEIASEELGADQAASDG